MASIFDALISVYRDSRDNVGAVCKLSSFLHSERHRLSVEQVRQETDHKRQSALKRQLLPAATISGVFKPKRGAAYLVRHSGFMCVDIDYQDNQEALSDEISETKIKRLKDYSQLEGSQQPEDEKNEIFESLNLCSNKDRTLAMLRAWPYNAYMARSCGGRGYFILVRLAHPERHLDHFFALEQEFKELGIVIDKSCKDVCRLRCVSWDDEPYINENAQTYTKTLPIPPIREGERNVASLGVKAINDTGSLPLREGGDRSAYYVEKCVSIIERCQIDIADSYDVWYKLGFALASMGEAGRDYFHRVSRQSRKYSHAECDRRFDQLMKDGHNKITLGTFFRVCKYYGVSWKDDPS